MRLFELAETSRRVADTSARLEKIELLANLLRDARADEVLIAVAYLSGDTPQGRLGIGPASLRDAWPGHAAAGPSLTLSEVDATFTHIAGASGTGSQAERIRVLSDLLARATAGEQALIAGLVTGELRQGALEGVMAEAVAKAAGVSSRSVRRALMLCGDLGEVARRALTEGKRGLAEVSLRLFRPIQPMLASSADDVTLALDQLEEAELEYKLDGARIQVHKGGSDVRVFSRQLNEVTAAVPEVVERIAALPVRELILDGEVLALEPDGAPRPFQTTMRRFGRKLDVAAMRQELPLTPFFFDCLFLDGELLLDATARQRLDALGEAVPGELVIPRIITSQAEQAQAFLDAARARGHEGVMAKDLDAPYQAGRRGKGWLKIKPIHTLDLVVLAAEWGHGRRRGWLSNLHLGAREPVAGGFVMLGKTFKGLTDKMLAWQTEALRKLEISRDRHIVYVEPRLVVEIAFNDIQASSRYPGGLALRFARVKRYRPDKRADQADTIDTVRRVYAGSEAKLEE